MGNPILDEDNIKTVLTKLNPMIEWISPLLRIWEV